MNNATSKSLVLLDEIGRGTSTFDGLSIAWAMTEYLHNSGHQKPRTLFATHYHELTELEAILPRVKNFNVTVREEDDRVVFLRKIKPGGCDHSYGIHVAQLAGMPPSVIERAKQVLARLEQNDLTLTKSPVRASQRRKFLREKAGVDQISMRLTESNPLPAAPPPSLSTPGSRGDPCDRRQQDYTCRGPGQAGGNETADRREGARGITPG